MPRGGKRPGSGRKKGGTNKITADVREAILKAFDLAGGVEYLCAVAREDPKPSAPWEQQWQELPRLRSSCSAYAEPIARQEEPSAFDIVRRVREEATEG